MYIIMYIHYVDILIIYIY